MVNMKNKKQILQVINILEYVAFIAATVMVLTSQFLPQYYLFVIIGLSCYVVGFFIAGFRAVLNCVEIFNASRLVNGEKQALVTNSKVEVLNTKKEKTQAILNAILWILLFVFALIVLILYPKVV